MINKGITILLCLTFMGCATTNTQKSITDNDLVRMIAGASDLTTIHLAQMSNRLRNINDFRFELDVNPKEMTDYVNLLFSEYSLKFSEGKRDKLIGVQNTIEVKAKYNFDVYRGELVVQAQWEYPDSLVRVTRAYSDSKEIVNPVTTFIRHYDLDWKLGENNE